MNDTKTVEKSYPNQTSLDMEEKPRQTSGRSPQSQIRQRKDGDNLNGEGIQDLTKYREKQEDRAFKMYQPNLWWFASTVFPLIAGTFGPIANLFSICALVHTWRRDKFTGRSVPDPPWLIVLNSCSLFLAIIANLILLFNFAHRIRYALAQPLTISLWYLSWGFLTIPITLTRLARLSPATHPNFAYSQSFYYAVISASLYFTISTLLVLNLIGTSRFIRAYPPKFTRLTSPQRTLMLQTISFSLYLALGGGVFAAIEGWSFTDGVYWADYTLLTIGLGSDFPLKTTLGRMLLIPYAPFGIILIGLVVGSVRGLVLERAKEKAVMRKLGKERDKWVNDINKMLQNGEEPKGLIMSRSKSLLLCWHWRHKKFQYLPRVIAHAKSPQHQDQWHQAEFELMRYIQITTEKSERYIALVVAFLAYLVVWIGGSLVFWFFERKQQTWTYPESLYFTFTTLLTIGYGDFFPISSAGKPFFVVWSLIAVPTMTVLIGHMGDTVVRSMQEVTDWMAGRTLLPEYRDKDTKEIEEEESGEVEGDLAASEPNRIKERSSGSYPALASPEPPGRPVALRNYGDLPLSPVESQEASAASQVESSLVPQDEGKPTASDSYTWQKSPQSKGKHNGHKLSQVKAEAALLAREISSLVRDMSQQPPKKYGWEEWVNWLKVLGDEGIADIEAMELDKEVSMNLPETSSNNQDTHAGHDGRRHKHYRLYHFHPNAKRNHGIGKDGDGDAGWHWTWLDDKGPLFSQQTETEWILSRLCSRLERLMND